MIIPSTTVLLIELTTTYLWTALQSMSFLGSFSEEFFHFPYHMPMPLLLPTHPFSTLGQNWCASSKNHLKWPKIKHEINSEVHCIKFNRLLTPVLLNKIGLHEQKLSKFLEMGIFTIITRCELGKFSHRLAHMVQLMCKFTVKHAHSHKPRHTRKTLTSCWHVHEPCMSVFNTRECLQRCTYMPNSLSKGTHHQLLPINHATYVLSAPVPVNLLYVTEFCHKSNNSHDFQVSLMPIYVGMV